MTYIRNRIYETLYVGGDSGAIDLRLLLAATVDSAQPVNHRRAVNTNDATCRKTPLNDVESSLIIRLTEDRYDHY